jgi:hypothetical protein
LIALRRGYTFPDIFEKVDQCHARNPLSNHVFELDPYDGAY